MMEIEINDDDTTQQQQQQNQPSDIATAADFPLLLSEKNLSTGEETHYYMRVNGRPPQPVQSLDAIDHWSKQECEEARQRITKRMKQLRGGEK